MGTKEKALARILSGKDDMNLTADEFFRGLRAAGWTEDRTASSHHIWISAKLERLSVPVHRGSVKPAYIRQARQIITDERS